MLRRNKDRSKTTGTSQHQDLHSSGSVPNIAKESKTKGDQRFQPKSSIQHASTHFALVFAVVIVCAVVWLQFKYRAKAYSLSWKNRVYSKWDGRIVDLMPSIQEYMRVSMAQGIFSAFQRVYVVKYGELYVSDLVPTNLDRMVAQRANITESLLTALVHRLPHGAVFLANYQDSRFCLNETLFMIGEQPIRMLPILTLSRPVTCEYYFPMPSYETIRYASKRVTETNDSLEDPPPWLKRDKRVVWRGSPTGEIRIELATFATKHADLLDYQLNFFLVTGKKGTSYMGPNDFQKYRAILDVDGASWSSRFGSLLCSSSVVLKFDPHHVDYFQDEIKPFVHYIPATNTSDLLDKARFVGDDKNTEFIATIIRNANHWCEQRLLPSEIEKDMTSVLLEYSRYSAKINVEQLMKRFSFSKVIAT